MNNLGILPKLTKDYILERLSQEDIMEYYTKIPVNTITLMGNSFTSPLREDNNPTCNYYYKEDSRGEIRLKLKDWNGSFDGDIFDIASFYTKISTKTGQGFALLLHEIAKTFNIHKYKNNKEEVLKLEKEIKLFKTTNQLKLFKVIPRKWNDFDKQYWYNSFGIDSNLLRLGKVIPVSELHIEDDSGYFKKIYNYYSKDPAFAYFGGKLNGINIWKIYFPFRNKTNRKFLTNYSFIQGLDIFTPSKVGIITKSLKDVLVYKSLGLEAIAIPSETYLMTKDEFFNIKTKCDITITNFDYDKAGILLANKYKKIHGCLPLMFTKGRFNQYDFGVKDMSEFRQQFGRDKSMELIQNLIHKYYEDLESLTLYNYNTLKWIV